MKPSQVKALDKLFSEVIRLRANGYCEYCHKYVKPEGINPSHYSSRVYKSVRWDEDNVQGLCHSCHMGFHNDCQSYRNWVFSRLGYERYDKLQSKALSIRKLDYEVIKEQLQNRIKELK